jgi:hypothetical protein
MVVTSEEKAAQERLKTKEQWLREEIRASRTVLTSLMQWGITALVAVELNLYYVRRDAKLHLVQFHILNEKELLPLVRWGIGTLSLCILALVFWVITRRVALHHQSYRRQLTGLASHGYSGIEEYEHVGGGIHFTPFILYFSVPIMDLFVWLLFDVARVWHFDFFIAW